MKQKMALIKLFDETHEYSELHFKLSRWMLITSQIFENT